MAVMTFMLVLIAMNPIGYRGGGSDDWHYLQAARCFATSGFCMPQNHWAIRMPLVLPLAATIKLLGESRQVLWIVPLTYGVIAATLLTIIVQRQFGRREALLAGTVFVATPSITDRLLRLNVDTVELAYALAAIFLIQIARRGRPQIWIPVAGALLGVAILGRATALAMVPLFLIGLTLVPRFRKHIPLFVLGVGAPLLLEALVYWP